jgi:AP2 domain
LPKTDAVLRTPGSLEGARQTQDSIVLFGANMKEIPLTKGFVALIDDEDFERVSQIKWTVKKGATSKTYYAQNSMKRLLLHRFVLGVPANLDVDHRDRNGLNCCKGNLRVSTTCQNKYNVGIRSDTTSGYKGVCWNKLERKWKVAIKSNKHSFHLGTFSDLLEAAHAYDVAAKTFHGEFACLNFPE